MKVSIIFDRILLIPSYNENISEKNCRENGNTHFMFNNFFSKTVPFMRKCGQRYGKARQPTNGNIILLMRCACWIPKATDTHTQNM